MVCAGGHNSEAGGFRRGLRHDVVCGGGRIAAALAAWFAEVFGSAAGFVGGRAEARTVYNTNLIVSRD